MDTHKNAALTPKGRETMVRAVVDFGLPKAAAAAVEALRRQRHTGKQIAAEVGVSAATVSRILRRLGLNRLSALEPAEPIRRYERAAPGEIIHIDIKKLGKFNRIATGSPATGSARAT